MSGRYRCAVVVAVLLLATTTLFADDERVRRVDRVQRQLRGTSLAQLPVLPATHDCDIKPSSCNTTINGTVTFTGCATDDLLYFNVYELSVAANTRVTVTLTSNVYRPFLVVFTDPEVELVASDLKPIGGTATVTFTNTTSVAKGFLVTVGPGDELDTGTFSMTITCAPISSGACIPTSTTMCLNNNRFGVTVTWRTGTGTTGTGTPGTITSDTGYFWFFNSANVELVIKILDGRAVNGKWWVFYGALSNVEYTIRVTDTQTGAVKTYTNPLNNQASVSDTSAF